MKIAIVNASPKTGKTNSGSFAKAVADCLTGKAEICHIRINNPKNTNKAFEAMEDCDSIVFCAPLYVDQLPSHFIHHLLKLEEMFRLNEKKPMVYGIINSGFFEGEQNKLALNILENWCGRAGLVWGGGLGIGGGEMLGGMESLPMGKGPKKKPGQTIQRLAELILNRQSGTNEFTSPSFPRQLYFIAANMSWKTLAKANGLKPKDLFRKPPGSIS